MKGSSIRMSLVEVAVISQKGKCVFGHKVVTKLCSTEDQSKATFVTVL
jgi:hypothetical protein